MYQNHTKDTNNNCNKSRLCDHKEKLIQAIKRIKHEVDECKDAERETYIESVEVEHRFDDLEREIRAEFQNLHRFLDEEECRDLERLSREKKKQLKQLKDREKKIAEQGRDLQNAIAVLNSKLTEDDSPKLLKEIQDLIKRSHVSFVLPVEIDTEVRSGQFVGPIQYRIWKHMKNCLYPIWFDDDKDTGDCQANPRRFNYYYCIFGHQAFISGRHYWEVEVGNKTAWRLGVAQEDVPRGEMAATGTSSGLWTLALKGGSIQACTDPQPTKIKVSLRLVRIGVFLDCEKEEVTFYNAITMSPIYTFSMETVGVPLFPYFNPCDTDDGKNIAPIKVFNPSL
ncbi:zinc-binding protein A33 isoform X2 [Stegastes partitus]|uniref:Zinc-binding protein A33 isoform X2 n=1 Tax=Stegastes partitus TaxID=144197 RepID=A0A9Y4NCR0_9TELE|nr:PREDICTED: zinc-binding protein A33-like isoform X2 [Stegastes partitus]